MIKEGIIEGRMGEEIMKVMMKGGGRNKVR